MRKRLTQEAEGSFAAAATWRPDAADAIRKEIVTALDTEVRSSSLIEHVNSALRPLLETCRGQVEQPMLDLFASVHNRRRFVRGKRAGQAPTATGIMPTPVDLCEDRTGTLYEDA